MRMPLNLSAWVDEHRHLLKPPVGNKQVFLDNKDFIVMVVGGPNGRKDYHVEPGEELFYQLEGDITLRIIENGAPRDVRIREGELYLLPANIPHSPQRPAGTIGLVIERYRREGEQDKLVWFCENCHNQLHAASFAMSDIVKELPPIMNAFMGSEELRTCDRCGAVMEAV